MRADLLLLAVGGSYAAAVFFSLRYLVGMPWWACAVYPGKWVPVEP